MFISKSKKLVKPKAPARRGTETASAADQPGESTPSQKNAETGRQTREEEEEGPDTRLFVAQDAPRSSSTVSTRSRAVRSREPGVSTANPIEVDASNNVEVSTRTRNGRRVASVANMVSSSASGVTRIGNQAQIPVGTAPNTSEPAAPLTPPATQTTNRGSIRKSKRGVQPRKSTRQQRTGTETGRTDHENEDTGDNSHGSSSTAPIVIDETDDIAQRLQIALANHEAHSANANLVDSNQDANPSTIQSNEIDEDDEDIAEAVAATAPKATTRGGRKRKQATLTTEDGQDNVQPARNKRTRTTKSGSRTKSANPTAGTITIEIPNEGEELAIPPKSKDRKRKGKDTEDPSTYRIEPTEVRMDELIADTHPGHVSQRELRLRERDVEIKRRKLEETQVKARGQLQEIMNDGETTDQPHATIASTPPRSPTPETAIAAPQFRIVNGQIIADETSRVIDRRAERTRAAEAPDDNAAVIEEDDLSRRTNSRSHTKYDNPTRWSPAATELFHKGLQYFGLEFSMMACLFPGRSRRQLKAKFIREERADVAFVNALLKDRQPVPSLEELEAIMGKKLRDPKELDEELRVQKEALEEAQRVEDQRAEERRLARERGAEEEGRRVRSTTDEDEEHEEDDGDGDGGGGGETNTPEAEGEGSEQEPEQDEEEEIDVQEEV